jgi:hypothetical protein
MFLPDEVVRGSATLLVLRPLREGPQPTTFVDAGGIRFAYRRLDR